MGRTCAGKRPNQVNAQHIAHLVGSWQLLSVSTRYCYHQQARALLRRLISFGLRPSLIDGVAIMPRPSPRGVVATTDELDTLIRNAYPALRLGILFAAHLGIRSGTIVKLGPQHWQRSQRLIAFGTKFGRQVTLPLTDQITALLDIACYGRPMDTKSTFLQLMHDGHGSCSQTWLQSEFCALRRSLELRDEITLHDLRRTVAVACYDTTNDLRVTSALLGHKDLAQTLWYLDHKTRHPSAALIAALANRKDGNE